MYVDKSELDDSPRVVGRGVSANGVEVDVNIEEEVAPVDVETRAAPLLRMTDMTVVGS